MNTNLTNQQRGWITRRKNGWKPKPLSEEHKQKLSIALKGRPKSKEHIQRLVESRRKGAGWACGEETKQKLSKALKGRFLGKPRSEQTKQKISRTLMGHPVSEQTRQKLSEIKKGRPIYKIRGPNHWNWKEDRLSIIAKRESPEYQAWHAAVLKRAKYTCQGCGQTGGQLEAHHIKPVEEYPELIFDVDNGNCRCIPCHAVEHPKRYSWIMARAV